MSRAELSRCCPSHACEASNRRARASGIFRINKFRGSRLKGKSGQFALGACLLSIGINLWAVDGQQLASIQSAQYYAFASPGNEPAPVSQPLQSTLPPGMPLTWSAQTTARVKWAYPLRQAGPADFSFATERARFIAARRALAAGDRESFDRLAAGLTHYPIYRYLEYERLRVDIGQTPGSAVLKAVNQFEKDYDDAVLTRRLIRRLQQALADDGQWRLFLSLSSSPHGASMPCASIRAKYELGQLKRFDKATSEFWASAKQRPKLCKGALTELEEDASPGIAALWNRIYDAIERNRSTLALDLSARLATKDRLRVRDWVEASGKPGSLSSSKFLKETLIDDVLNRRIVRDLVWRWSKTDPVAAHARWRTLRDRYRFRSDNRYELDRMLALRGAYRRMPEAVGWLNDFDAREDDLEVMEWRVRSALLADDWNAVLNSIARLPEVEQAEDHWQYWVARAHERLGRDDQALSIYRTLSTLQSYYGFLSADRLGRAYALREEPIDATRAIRAKLVADPQMIRAREYYHTLVSWEGRREWAQALENFSLEEKAATAVVARQWGMVDRAIVSAGLAEKRRALSYRFPVLYDALVEQAAHRNQLEAPLVYGVMRRESAFMADIRSGAGAVGLMQLMPGTASDVSKSLGESSRGDLTDPATNINYGSHYLRQMLDRFANNELLALAAYNAGPHRVDKWMTSASVAEPDRWVDTIPYSETRRYVRAVMAYSVIFDWRLSGQPTPLRERMPVVQPVEIEPDLVASPGSVEKG